MEAFLSEEVLAGLKKARMDDARKHKRLRVHAGDEIYPVFKLWDDGFAILAEDAPHLRGFVDLYDGARHLLQCLVIHSEPEGDLVNFEFKRKTATLTEAPKDYAVDANAPVGLITG